MDAVAEGAEAVGWIDCLRQGRSTSGATIIPPEDSLTPGMSEVAKSAANWENNRMTTRRVCQLLTAMGVLSPGTAQVKDEKDKQRIQSGNTVTIITYGMGVYWAKSASEQFPGQIDIIDMRTLCPIDEELIFESVKTHSRCLIITEEPCENSFAQALSGRIQKECFSYLDAPVSVIPSNTIW